MVYWVVLGTVMGHMLCCGLPLLVGVLSLLSGAGVLSSVAPGLEWLHGRMHDFEMHLIGFSAVMLALGWFLYFYSRRHDCHDTGCHHPPCDTRKGSAAVILWIATIIFLGNLAAFIIVPAMTGVDAPHPATNPQVHHHDHHH